MKKLRENTLLKGFQTYFSSTTVSFESFGDVSVDACVFAYKIKINRQNTSQKLMHSKPELPKKKNCVKNLLTGGFHDNVMELLKEGGL